MKLPFHAMVICCLMAVAAGPSIARQAGMRIHSGQEDRGTETQQASDPLGRDTPQGTVLGFLQAAEGNKYKQATQYLQLSKNERATEGERVVRELRALMDGAFVGRVGQISSHPEGSDQAGVPEDRERIGEFRLNGTETNVDLVRISDPEAGEIWLFSSKTLAKVPDLFLQIEISEVESELPHFLVGRDFLNIPLWSAIAFLLLVPLSLGLAWVVVYLLRVGMRGWLRWRHNLILEDVAKSFRGPAMLILTVIFHRLGVSFLGIGLLMRVYYQHFASIITACGLAWLMFRLINRWAERARTRARESSGDRTGSIVLLGQRMLKVLVVFSVALLILSFFGFNMRAALAGLGIGGLLIAFAAQKTLENILGGVSILTDQAIRVGELCRIDGKTGIVEDISLRSTRIRMLDRTALLVPNAELATINIENLSRRDKHLFQTRIGLRSETSPDQLRSLLAEIESYLYQHPKADSSGVRVRFVGFGESSLDVEIFCLVLTADWNEFLEIREGMLLRIMELVANAGTDFAFPSRTLYMTQDQGLDSRRAALLEKNASSDRIER